MTWYVTCDCEKQQMPSEAKLSKRIGKRNEDKIRNFGKRGKQNEEEDEWERIRF